MLTTIRPDVREGDPQEPETLALAERLATEIVERYSLDLHPERIPVEPVSRDPYLVVARVDGRIVGFGEIVRLEGPLAEVSRMFVEPELRRKGIARTMLAALEEHAASRGASTVRIDSGFFQPEAIRLCETNGYDFVPMTGIPTDRPRSLRFEKTLAR